MLKGRKNDQNISELLSRFKKRKKNTHQKNPKTAKSSWVAANAKAKTQSSYFL